MEPDITIQINSWTALLQAGLILLLLIIVPAWLGYDYGGRHKASFWQETMNHLPLGAVIFDNQRGIVFKNDPASALLKELPPNVIERVRQVKTRGNPYTAEVKGLAGSQINLQSWALGETNASVLLLLRNVTHDHGQGQSVYESDQKFIFEMAHEMASPLNIIDSTLRTADNDELTPTERHDILQKTRKKVGDLIQLVTRLRVLQLLDSGQPIDRGLRRYKMADVAHEIVDQLEQQARDRQISLVVEPSPNLPPVNIDVGGWREVFQNLVGNSIKYGKPGGTVRITIQQQLSALVVSVADDGPGIAAEDLDHLFEKGFRGASSSDIEGNGIGLYIVRRVVEQHGGEIYPESEPGRGTTFHITLPLNHQL